MIKNITLLLAFAIFHLNIQSQESESLTDQVSILKLDQKLSSRGQLGGVTVDRLGYIYVANFSDAVWKISPQGKVKLLTDGLYGSSGNAIDSKGNVFQANFLSHSIVKIDRFGQISYLLKEGLNGPVGMVFDKNDNLYICNFNENNILKYTSGGNLSVFAGGKLINGPNGITIDNQGNLFVVNFNSNQVVKITPEGEPSTFVEIPGADGNAHIVFYNDNLYVTKIKTNQLFQINAQGAFKLLGGTGKTAITEGPALSASFAAPNGIGVDSRTGELYINNLKGQWTVPQASEIEISRVKLLSLQQILSYHLDQNDLDAAKEAFWTYHKDDFHAHEDLGLPLGTLGWQYMVKRNVQASIMLFTLMSEAYPDRWQSYFYLGDVYKIMGQMDQAKAFYKQALERDADNQVLKERLEGL